MHPKEDGGQRETGVEWRGLYEGDMGAVFMDRVTCTLKPYLYDGRWVFDDHARRLWAIPLVARGTEIVDEIIRRAGLPARRPFRLTFGDQEIREPGYRFAVDRVREDAAGHWYRWGGMECLCPALMRYFDAPPVRMYWAVAERRTPFSIGVADPEVVREAASWINSVDFRRSIGRG